MEKESLNIGQLAFNETENIKRQIAIDKSNFDYSRFHNQTKNITATDNHILFSQSFISHLNNNISFSFCFKTNQIESDESYKVLIMLNDIAIKDYEVYSGNSHYFQVNFSAAIENSLKVVLKCNNQVVFNEVECELLGNFEKQNNVNNELFVSTQSLLKGVGVVNFSNNAYNFHYYPNNESFLNNFYKSKTSSVNMQGVLDFCFLKPSSSDTSEHPVVLLSKNGKVVIKNLQTNAEEVVFENDLGHYTIFSLPYANSALICVSFNGNTITIKQYSKSFVLQKQESGTHNFNHKITKIGAFSSSIGSYIDEVCLLILTQSNELYVLFSRESLTSLRFSDLNKIASAENFYFESSSLENLVVFSAKNNHVLKTTYKKLNIGYRKLHSKTVPNARFGFVLNNNQSVYYFINRFSVLE